MNSERRTMTVEQWRAEGERLFGADELDWKFVCPSCGHVASVAEWKDAGAGPGEIAYSCVGRRMTLSPSILGDAPCDYAGGGLFRLNPITVTREGMAPINVFAFYNPTSEQR